MIYKKMHIGKTKSTPEVIFDDNGTLRISGLSMMEDTFSFYNPINNWISSLNIQINKLDFCLDYLSTSSSIAILELIKNIKSKYPGVIIVWKYEEDDESIYRLGEDLELTSGSKIIFQITE